MSFLHKFTHIKKSPKQKKYYKRKEKIDSLTLTNRRKERASVFTSKGSLTLEAAIVVPIFFFSMLCLAYLLEIMAMQSTIKNALYSAGKETAEIAYSGNYVTPNTLENRIVENIGVERLENSAICDGANGIDCKDTGCNPLTGVIDLHVQYQIEMPIPLFKWILITCEEELRVKAWMGYAPLNYDATEKERVYVTDTGIVYHADPNCTYLDMSIREISMKQVEELRNQSGGIYYACDSCGEKERDKEICYITDYGTRYHTSLECKKIKRNIYAITLDEAYGLGECSKCVN